MFQPNIFVTVVVAHPTYDAQEMKYRPFGVYLHRVTDVSSIIFVD
jgi:hypothetical protein